MTAKAPKGDYVVGRGKPPVHSQFQPGQSGNLRGRPKGAKDMHTLIEKELDERVTLTERGRQVSLSKRELIAKQAVNKAAAGDPRMLILLKKSPGPATTGSAADDPLRSFDSEDDDLTLLDYLRRLKEDSDEPR